MITDSSARVTSGIYRGRGRSHFAVHTTFQNCYYLLFCFHNSWGFEAI